MDASNIFAPTWERPEQLEALKNFEKRRGKQPKKSLAKARRFLKEAGFSPHQGTNLSQVESIADVTRDFFHFSALNVDDSWLAEIEGFLALMIALKDVRSYSSFAAIIYTYVRKYTDSSVTGEIMAYIRTLFMESHSGEEEEDVVQKPAWIDMLSKLGSHWEHVRESVFFTHVSNLIGLLVTLGLCKASRVTFSLGEYTVFEPNMKSVHRNALDIVDACLRTAKYFVETISLCWRHRSLRPLIHNSDKAMEMDDEFARLNLWWDLVKNGNLMKIEGVSDQEFDSRLDKLTGEIRSHISKAKNFERRILDAKFQQLLRMRNDYTTLKISCGIRPSPFTLELFGASAQGKTTCADQIVFSLLRTGGYDTSREKHASYNPGDKYMSSWRTDKLVMFIDDMANDKSSHVERPPTRAIIDICNNQAYYANMADLDSKGKVFVEPKIVMVTTNVKSLDAGSYSNCPYSIQRRMHFCITVEAKPECQRIENGIACGLCSERVDEYYASRGITNPPIDDIWNLTVERAVEPGDLSVVAEYAPVQWKGQEMVGVSMLTVINFLNEQFAKHESQQAKIMERMRTRHDLEVCPHPNCRQLKGLCMEHDHLYVGNLDGMVDEESIEDEVSSMSISSVDTSRDSRYKDSDDDPWSHINIKKLFNPHNGREKWIDIENFLAKARYFLEMWDWIHFIPEFVYRTHYFQLCLLLLNKGAIIDGVKRYYVVLGCLSIFPYCLLALYNWSDMSCFYSLAGVLSSMLCAFWIQDRVIDSVKDFVHFQYKWRRYSRYVTWSECFDNIQRVLWFRSAILWLFFTTQFIFSSVMCNSVLNCGFFAFMQFAVLFTVIQQQIELIQNVMDTYTQKLAARVTISSLIKSLKQRHVKQVCSAVGFLGIIYGASRLYASWKKLYAQGSLEPKTQEQVDERDNQKNVWTQVWPRSLPQNDLTRNTTADQMRGLIEKNLVYGSVHFPDKVMMVNCLFMRSNVILIPNHYFEKDELEITFRKHNPESSGGKFIARLSKNLSYHVPNTDLRYCYVATGGSFKDIGKFLADDELPFHEFALQWRARDGEMLNAGGLMAPADTTNGVAEFRGYLYDKLSINTFAGMCGAVLTSRVKPIISSIHLGGRAGTPNGCSGQLLAEPYIEALAYLRSKEGVILSGTAEKFEPQILGVSVLNSAPLHEKSPLNYMPESSQIEYYGSCPGKMTFKSDVKVTLISEHVTDVMGYPNKFGGPVVNPDWYGWQTCLANMSNPATPFPPNLLEKAILDYKHDLIPLFKSKLWRTARPLTTEENINGVPGKKFMDAIKMNTAIGFPLTGNKAKYLMEGHDQECVGDRKFESDIMDEIERCESCYARGERAYTIAKACKKDEILAKKKCRIFYGNSIALTFLIRKYFLPLLRVMQMNPLVSECAVGVNSHGPEWDDLHKHVLKFGKDRIIGGDYGKYDQKLPSQLLFAALRVLMDFARCCNYKEDDISIMEAMTGDIVFALIAYNGDLIGLTEGTHISGNSLTVIINGICGSLNLRCYYYEKRDLDFSKRSFRKDISLMTYGDDNIGSVRDGVDFTIIGASKFLERYGQTYTMPDKTSELLEYLPYEQFEFLKRKSVYHSVFDKHIGALIDESCFKMLHCYMRSKKSPLSEEHASAQNIDTALREWFNHGQEKYEERRSQLKEVAARADLTHLCLTLDKTYDDVALEWKQSYAPDTLEEDTREFEE